MKSLKFLAVVLAITTGALQAQAALPAAAIAALEGSAGQVANQAAVSYVLRSAVTEQIISQTLAQQAFGSIGSLSSALSQIQSGKNANLTKLAANIESTLSQIAVEAKGDKAKLRKLLGERLQLGSNNQISSSIAKDDTRTARDAVRYAHAQSTAAAQAANSASEMVAFYTKMKTQFSARFKNLGHNNDAKISEYAFDAAIWALSNNNIGDVYGKGVENCVAKWENSKFLLTTAIFEAMRYAMGKDTSSSAAFQSNFKIGLAQALSLNLQDPADRAELASRIEGLKSNCGILGGAISASTN